MVNKCLDEILFSTRRGQVKRSAVIMVEGVKREVGLQ